MPGFIKTPADEKKWNAIKHSVAKQRGKNTKDFTDRDWATVNAAWHKSEGNLEKFESVLKSLNSMDKPSTFFKKEEFVNIKQPSIENLRIFLEKTRHKS